LAKECDVGGTAAHRDHERDKMLGRMWKLALKVCACSEETEMYGHDGRWHGQRRAEAKIRENGDNVLDRVRPPYLLFPPMHMIRESKRTPFILLLILSLDD
jgi:hypothetical protein